MVVLRRLAVTVPICVGVLLGGATATAAVAAPAGLIAVGGSAAHGAGPDTALDTVATGRVRPSPIGAWNVTVSRPNGGTENASAVFGPGGRVVVKAEDGEVSVGRWHPTGNRSFTFGFTRRMLDGGTAVGTIRVTHDAELGGDGSTFTSTGTASAYDLDGNPIGVFPISSSATRVG